MPEEIEDGRKTFAKHLLEDAADRVRYQHDFAQAAFKTLILVNGGAIVAMLTYAADAMKGGSASSLRSAFIWYCAGVVSTLLAHLCAYFSQGKMLQSSLDEAARLLNLTLKNPTPRAGRFGTNLIFAAIACTAVSVGSFIAGSFSALHALSG